jgi:ribosomal protein L2
MPLLKAKPTSAGRRHVVQVINPDLHKGAPHAPLLDKLSKSLAETTMVVLRFVILVVVINNTIV